MECYRKSLIKFVCFEVNCSWNSKEIKNTFVYISACECNEKGSAKLQCDRTNGSCVCLPGIGGSKCDECARGYITLHRPIPGYAPSCSPCGECFENWDRVLGELSSKSSKDKTKVQP